MAFLGAWFYMDPLTRPEGTPYWTSGAEGAACVEACGACGAARFNGILVTE